jgi:hypothetical protein
MAEVFGYRITDLSDEAKRHRKHRLCPFNNKVPSCTKDKVDDPLGVCSIYEGDDVTVTCPVRFRQDWLIATDAAEFFFQPGTVWTSLTEVRLNDANGKSAGNIDVVLVAYDGNGLVTDFGALEVQAVYISGNVRNPFAHYMTDPEANTQLNWRGQPKYPRADFLSSSRKRLAPQLIYKGGILHSWHRKMAVAVDRPFFSELPSLPEVDPSIADVAWLVYDLKGEPGTDRYRLTKERTVYTQFTPALLRITNPEPGSEEPFLRLLQRKLKERQRLLGLAVDTMEIVDLFADEHDLEANEE